jgi:subtilisin family serine protease
MMAAKLRPLTRKIRTEPLTMKTHLIKKAVISLSCAALWQSVSAQPETLANVKLTDPANILRELATNTTTRVIVNLSGPAGAQASNLKSQAGLRSWQAAVRSSQEAVLTGLSVAEARVRRRFENISAFSAAVTEQGLKQLQSDPRVISIEPVHELQPHLAQGIPLIGADTYRSTYNGSGVAIAICDTGVDYTHARLGGGGFPNSKVLGGYDFGEDDGDPIPGGDAHGTACAGIAAGDLETVDDYIGGVAHNSKIYALKIVEDNDPDGASSDDMIAAWDWCVTHQNDDPNNPILVISTSFGGGQHFANCDSYITAMTTAANNAVAAGITLLVSSGNDGYCDSIAWPACISSVISVGAVYDANFGIIGLCVKPASCATPQFSGGCPPGDNSVNDSTAADKVTAYANVASFLDVFAPGNQCYTLDIVGNGGYSATDYASGFGGTSAACPYAAGVVACLQAANKALTGTNLTPAEVRVVLSNTGDIVTDTKVAISKPRVNLANAIVLLTDPLQIAPTAGFASAGTQGGPFSPSCMVYALTNVGASSLSWTATNNGLSWLTVTPDAGTLDPMTGTNVSVCINTTNANLLALGSYLGTIAFSNNTIAVNHIRTAALNITPTNDQCSGAFVIAGSSYTNAQPTAAATSIGDPTPSCIGTFGKGVWYQYTPLSNGTLWVDTMGSSFDTGLAVYIGTCGSLVQVDCDDDGGGNLTSRIRKSVDAGVTYYIMAGGFNGESGDLVLHVELRGPTFLTFAMDSDPGWARQGNWEFGIPLGSGGVSGVDPTSGHTGANVLGYNLSGNYSNSIPAYYLTTTALDCSAYTNITLSFWRWLGVESSSFDHATVQVSSNATTWVTIWVNDSASMMDRAWQLVSYNISSTANRQSTVYARWGMGTTDGSVEYPGWNIDDVELSGHIAAIAPPLIVPGSVSVQSGLFGMNISGQPGYQLEVWASTNLVQWQLVQTLNNVGGTIPFQEAVSNQLRFYKVRQVP